MNYLYYWIPIPFLILVSFIFNKPLDIASHDNYIATNTLYLSILFSIFLFISGLGYFLYQNKGMNPILQKTHNWFSIIGIAIICILSYFRYTLDSKSDNFVEYENIELFIQIATWQLIGAILLLLGFIVYIINVLMAILQKSN